VGDRVVNRDYGLVLRAIAKDGAEAFYRGEIAETIDADMRARGGLLRRSDLESFQIVRNVPLSRSYRNFRVTTNQAPGGGIMLLEMLGTLENFDLRSLGHNSAEYVRVVAEAMKAATRDKDLFIGDPSFVDVPTERLISKDHCAEIADARRLRSPGSTPACRARRRRRCRSAIVRETASP
jgi:gamma-glutamyltranspeptidase/glutathione hydrolase